MARRKRRRPALEREGQIRCRYCGGFYNSVLPECPNCGHQTEENQSYATDWRHISPEECAGGFGGADHLIRRAAAWLAGGLAVLFVVVCVVGVTRGVAWSSGGGSNTWPAVVNDADASSSAQPDESGDAATSARTAQDAAKQGDTPQVAPPQAIALNHDNVAMQAGEELEVKATLTPEDWKGTVTWSTDDKYVAWVNQQGKVICFGGGSCTITATAGDQIAVCQIRSVSAVADHAAVDAKVKELEAKDTQNQTKKDNTDTKQDDAKKEDNTDPMAINLTDTTLVNVGDTYQFKVTGGDGNYRWSSAGPWVATVDQNGVVTAVGRGYATITCTDGSGQSVKTTVRVR